VENLRIRNEEEDLCSSEFLRINPHRHRGIEQMSQQTFPPGSKVIIDDFDQSYNRTVATVKKYSRSKKLYTVTAHDKVILKVKQCSIFYAGDRLDHLLNR